MVESRVDRGILLLDKPPDLTSMQCVEKAKKHLAARKAGHSGTLDPKVTGLMLIAFNEATKAMPVFNTLRKKYEGFMRIHGPFSEEQLSRAVRKFTGIIEQLPPRRSAVARKPRKREIYSLEITDVSGRNVRFSVSCEAGTYIRKLCHDIGEYLGTGAHMTGLRRVGIGPFSVSEAVTMEQLESTGESVLVPLEDALRRSGLPMARAPSPDITKIRNGLKITIPRALASSQGLVGILDSSGMIIALAEASEGNARPVRVFRWRKL